MPLYNYYIVIEKKICYLNLTHLFQSGRRNQGIFSVLSSHKMSIHPKISTKLLKNHLSSLTRLK
jgi:hypothetical protein